MPVVDAQARWYPQAFVSLLRRFCCDTITHNPQILRFLIEMVGADRVVIGSDYNFDAGYPSARPMRPAHPGAHQARARDESSARTPCAC